MRSTDSNRQYAADLAQCRSRLRVGSRSFHAAAYLMPREFCEPAAVLYAFCRIADDAVDDDPNPDFALRELRARLDALYAGTPYDDPADRAMAYVVGQFAIPKSLFEALFEGFSWDAAGRRYVSFDELLDYAARVAGTVGAMMALLMGVRDPDRLARACDLGAAMQLSNIARDVGEDARAGRVYLPSEWLDEAGVDTGSLSEAPRFTKPLARVVQRLLREADRLYARADSGIAGLPAGCRPAIYAARLLYAEIGREVERQGCNSIRQRAVVSPWRKANVLSRLRRLSMLPTAALKEPALASTAFLVREAAELIPPEPVLAVAKESSFSFMLGMIDELNRRDREAELALAQQSAGGRQ